ncbi:MAG: hypothetical protein LBP33_13165, partial [Candidatus Adiutrix sp.]|nr:hypothetical protein [Candidatus Adiutrix sp.]
MMFKGAVRKFFFSRRGSLTIAAALCLAPVVALTFAAIQINQRSMQQTRLHQAETAAVLAVGKEGEDVPSADRELLTRAYLEQNLRVLTAAGNGGFDFSLERNDDLELLRTSLAVTPLATRLLDGIFEAPVQEIEPVKSERFYRPIEVVVLMDASMSMLGQRDMLMEMAEKVTDTLYRKRDSADDVWLSLIAYSGFVNIGHEYAARLITPESRMLYMPDPTQPIPPQPVRPMSPSMTLYSGTGLYATIDGINYVRTPSTSPYYYTKNPKYIEDLAAYNAKNAVYQVENAEYTKATKAAAEYLTALQRQDTLREYSSGLPVDLLGPEGPGTGSVDMVCPSRKPLPVTSATAGAIREYVENLEVPPDRPSEGFHLMIGDGRYYKENLAAIKAYPPSEFLNYGAWVLSGDYAGLTLPQVIDFVDLVKMPKHYIVNAERYDLLKAENWGFSPNEVVTVPLDCPTMPMLVGSTDKREILETISKFRGVWSTGGDEGIAWAMRALSPAWREIWEK